MPYSQNTDLPERVTNVLSENAQDIYRDAFNGAWDDNDNPANGQDDESREDAAHDVAWGAVKKAYDKGHSSKWPINQPAGKFAFVGLALLAFSVVGTFFYMRSKGTKFEKFNL